MATIVNTERIEPSSRILPSVIPGDVKIQEAHATEKYVVFSEVKSGKWTHHLVAIAESRYVGTLGIGDEFRVYAGGHHLFVPGPLKKPRKGMVGIIDESEAGNFRQLCEFEHKYYRMAGDLADDQRRVFVGNYAQDSNASGEVHCFDTTEGGALKELGVIPNPYPDQYDQFGADLCLQGDYLFVSTPGDETVSGSRGTIYVYDVSGEDYVGNAPVASLSGWDGGGGRITIIDKRMYVVIFKGNSRIIEVYDIGSPDVGLPKITTFERDWSGHFDKGIGQIDGNLSFICENLGSNRQYIVVIDSHPNSGTFGGQLVKQPIPDKYKVASAYRHSSETEGLVVVLETEGADFRNVESVDIY